MRSMLVDPIETWKEWAGVVGVRLGDLSNWQKNLKHQFHCIFCGTHGDASKFINGCPKCNIATGVEPCIHNYCEFGR